MTSEWRHPSRGRVTVVVGNETAVDMLVIASRSGRAMTHSDIAPRAVAGRRLNRMMAPACASATRGACSEQA
jgi:hypothetical protein